MRGSQEIKKSVFLIVGILLVVFSITVVDVQHKNSPDKDISWVNSDHSEMFSPWYSNNLDYSNVIHKNISIGIIDGPINVNHEQLQNIDIESYSIVSRNQSSEEDMEHGTSNLGIITSDHNNGSFRSMVDSKNVKVYSAEVLNHGFAKQKDVAEAINWLLENNVKVINISLDFDSIDYDLKEALNKANDQKVPIFMAYGNGNYSISEKHKINKYTWYVDLKTQNERNKDVLQLPGKDMVSISSKNKYDLYNGSSYATALATAITVQKLLMSENIILTPNNIEKTINKYEGG